MPPRDSFGAPVRHNIPFYISISWHGLLGKLTVRRVESTSPSPLSEKSIYPSFAHKGNSRKARSYIDYLSLALFAATETLMWLTTKITIDVIRFEGYVSSQA